VRLALSLSGTPNDTARWFSMTALIWIAVIYCSIRIHTVGFGSYKQLVVICALLNLTTQVISITGILISIATGTDNIFSAPDFAFNVGSKVGPRCGPRFHRNDRRNSCAVDRWILDPGDYPQGFARSAADQVIHSKLRGNCREGNGHLPEL
jgi:hypothetical protein